MAMRLRRGEGGGGGAGKGGLTNGHKRQKPISISWWIGEGFLKF